MPLQRLTGLERDKIERKFNKLMVTIEDLRDIIASPERQIQIIKDEVTERFGDERPTEIVYAAEEFDIENLIAEEDMVVTISREGYCPKVPRGGRSDRRADYLTGTKRFRC